MRETENLYPGSAEKSVVLTCLFQTFSSRVAVKWKEHPERTFPGPFCSWKSLSNSRIEWIEQLNWIFSAGMIWDCSFFQTEICWGQTHSFFFANAADSLQFTLSFPIFISKLSSTVFKKRVAFTFVYFRERLLFFIPEAQMRNRNVKWNSCCNERCAIRKRSCWINRTQPGLSLTATNIEVFKSWRMADPKGALGNCAQRKLGSVRLGENQKKK